MFNRDEKGQSVILIAISIVLILTVAFSVYNIQMLLVAKQKVRQMTDATAFAGALSRKIGLESFQQIANLDVLLALSWELGTAWEYLLDAADYVHNVAPGYDATADFLATENSISNIVPIKNHISFVHEKGLVEDETYIMAQQYLILEALLYAKAVEERNLAISTFPSGNHLSLLIPSEMILNQGPVLSYTELTYVPYNWTIGSKDGRMIFLIEKPDDPGGGSLFHTTIGLACVELVNSPETLFSSMLSSLASTKSGKLVAFAYAYPYNMEDVSGAVFVPVDSFVNDLESINVDQSLAVKRIRQISLKPHPTEADITELKTLWDTIVADYNYLLQFCEEAGLLDVLNIGSSEYKSNPVMGSLHTLNLLEMSSYQDIADAKGIDYSTQTGENAFYNTLSLEDIFGTKEKFWQDLRTTYQTLIDNNNVFSDDLTELLNTCKFFDETTAGGNNIPYFLKEVPMLINSNIENSTLQDFLTLSSQIGLNITQCYSNLLALPNITSSSTDITVDDLMPGTEMLDFLSQIFSAPIVRWEGS